MHQTLVTARTWRSRVPDVSPRTFRRLSVVSLVAISAIVLTGAAVRLTGSGLGCSDWPACTKTHVTPPLQFHSLIEFSNRMVTVVLVILFTATFLAALVRRPRRRDLSWLSGILVAGVFAEAVIGGIVVYTKLNPYMVMVHFLATLALVVDATVLVHRAGRVYGRDRGRLLVPRPVLACSRGCLALLAIVVAAGSATTGAAPDAGNAVGQQVARRIQVPLRDLAELHSSLALLLVGVTVGLAVALHALDVPERVRKSSRILIVVLVLQAAVGYVQYFTHLPAAVVEIHELGATVLVIGFVQYFLALTHHAPERFAARLQAVPDVSGLPGVPGGLAGVPGGLPGVPGGLAGVPGGLPGVPGGLAGVPGGAGGLADGAGGLADGAALGVNGGLSGLRRGATPGVNTWSGGLPPGPGGPGGPGGARTAWRTGKRAARGAAPPR